MSQSRAGLRLLVAATTAAVLGSCGGAVVDTQESRSATASASAFASAAAGGPGVSPEPAGLVIGTEVRVIADEVRLRASAGTDGTITGSLVRDATARVTDGPIEADGYTWYEVDGPDGLGWLAAGDGTDPWIVSVPERTTAEVLFRFRFACDVTPPLVPPAFTLLTDGRVVVAGGGGWAEGAWQVRQLTDAGLQQALAATVDRPELQRSAEFRPERRPGVGDPPGHGGCAYTFTAGSGVDGVVVRSTSWFGEPEESTYYLPSPERRSLDQLARQLMEGGTFLSGEAWAGPAERYAADSFLVWMFPEPSLGGADLPALTEPGPLGSSLEEFGEPVPGGRCGYLAVADATSLGSSLAARGQPFSAYAISYGSVQADEDSYTLVISPRTPDGYPTCADLPR